MDQALKMDRMYRYQRHIYDLTRSPYLLGRNVLLREMPVNAGDLILETGCGTARNLRALAKTHPKARLFGLDASREMLKTAEVKLAQSDLRDSVTLRQGLAEHCTYQETFKLREPFDLIFFSYSLSMIPLWKAALQTALANLKSQGWLFILDFGDQRDLPALFGKSLQKWLALFDVKYRPEFQTCLSDFEKRSLGRLAIKPLFRNYALLARFQKR